jgi:hypothetical protein
VEKVAQSQFKKRKKERKKKKKKEENILEDHKPEFS